MRYIIYYDNIARSPAMCEQDYFRGDKLPLHFLETDDFEEAFLEFSAYCPEGKFPVLFIEPLCAASITFIYPETDELQRMVGGSIEIIAIQGRQHMCIVCNEEAKKKSQTMNRACITDGLVTDIICGPFIIGAFTEGGEGEITRPGIQDASDMYYTFKEPEVFLTDADRDFIRPVKCTAHMTQFLKENSVSLININSI